MTTPDKRMSDGMSDSRRDERILRNWNEGCELIQCALQEMHDAAFGVPFMVLQDLHRPGEQMSLVDAGLNRAPCAVCGDPTTLRVVLENAGHVPMCSRFCEHAWPRVSRLYSALTEIRKLVASDVLGVLDRIEREVELALESNSEDKT